MNRATDAYDALTLQTERIKALAQVIADYEGPGNTGILAACIEECVSVVNEKARALHRLAERGAQ
jgi:hypothetical protein